MYQTVKLYAMLMTIVMVIGVLSLSIGLSSVTNSIDVGNIGEISYQLVAKSGLAADIQSAVNTAASAGGGKVIVPAGTWHWNVTSTTLIGTNIPCAVVIPPGVSVVGTGLAGCNDHPSFLDYTAQTIIVLDSPRPPNAITPFGIDGQNVAGKPVRISGVEFVGITPSNTTEENSDWRSAIYLYRAIDYRVDHCTFTNWASEAIFTDSLDHTCYGVVDHCRVRELYKLSGSGWVWGYGFYGRGYYAPGGGYASWDSNVSHFFGQYGPVASYPIMYVEDCHFSYCRHCLDGCMGAFYCARYCLFDNSLDVYQCGMADLHGTPDSVGGGGRGNEVYNCTFIGPPLGGWWNTQDWAYQLRGGSGLFYNNDFTSQRSDCNMVYLSMQDDSTQQYPTQEVHNTYLWNNAYNGVLCVRTTPYYLQVDSPLTENSQYFLRAPNQAQDGFTYTPYPYPHPLTTG